MRELGQIGELESTLWNPWCKSFAPHRVFGFIGILERGARNRVPPTPLQHIYTLTPRQTPRKNELFTLKSIVMGSEGLVFQVSTGASLLCDTSNLRVPQTPFLYYVYVDSTATKRSDSAYIVDRYSSWNQSGTSMRHIKPQSAKYAMSHFLYYV